MKGKRQKTKGKRRRSIPRASAFFLFPFAFSLLALAQPKTPPATLPSFEIVGTIDSPVIRESSGLVRSRKYPGVYWTHNDSGNSATIFAITREGKLISQFEIDAPNTDWEDIALDDSGNLYLADIGNNTVNRSQVQIYRLPEPDPHSAPSQKKLKIDRIWRITYPDKPFDAESLCVWGETGYILSKHRDGSESGIYRFSLKANERPIDLEKLGVLPIRVPVTGADISPDGKWLAVMTVAGPHVFEIDGEVTRAGKGRSRSMIFLDPVCESVCFVPGGLLASTEGRRMVFFPMEWESRVPATLPGSSGRGKRVVNDR